MLPAINALGDLSITGWWPLRGLLLIVTVLAIGLTLWFARRIGSILLATALVAGLVLANLAAAANAYYETYPTVRALLAGTPSTTAFGEPAAAPPQGQVVPVSIPGRRSGFAARQAFVHLPPAWFAEPRPALPVVVLLHDTPGSPRDWLDDGAAARTADAWAAEHGGVAPVLVLPDVTGEDGAARGCVDSPLGNVETYLTVDVPEMVQAQFSTVPPGQGWAVAGNGAGGACATTLALRNPELFGTFGNFGGLGGPRLGPTNAETTTAVDQLFDSSPERFAEHEPAELLSARRYPGSGAWFQVGSDDTEPLTAAAQLAPLAAAAGADTCLVVRPGTGPEPATWSAAFADSLPWMAGRLGLVARSLELVPECGPLPGP
jgi:S-formylglutathione hydrolase FrmB